MVDSGTQNIKSSFESKVLKGLSDCGVDLRLMAREGGVIGAAVSGGADSLSMLMGLASLSIPIEVITVNHNIRPAAETCGDAAFVVETCNRLKAAGYNVNCTVVELPPGLVEKTARQRQAGTEEAARFLRYNAFEKFIAEKNLHCLCLAHNKNDQLETVLMRFLQGSSSDSAGGIKIRRGKYIRPLLNITRAEIEEYLKACGFTWCEDKTNNDTAYFRNNVRHNLIPFLNMHFDGWEKAVLSGAEKAGEDADVIQERVLAFPMEAGRGNGKNHHSVSFSLSDFLAEKTAVQRRVLIKAFNLAGEQSRISNSFLNDFIESPKGTKVYHNTEISVKKDLIFVKKHNKKVTDFVFFGIIEESGTFDFPFGKFTVTFNDSNVCFSINGCDTVVSCSGPVVVRNFQQGDEIKNNDGNMKKVADIFSDWHVEDYHRKLIPVIYELKSGADNIKCILGRFLGYKDWIVK